MNANNTVSIIVPVFNAQEYLDKCINSILRQTYSDIELILINDGSTDHSEEICMNYSQSDSRIIYSTQTNAGPSAARNHGISISKGKYIQFLDSDDYLNEDSVEILIKAIQQSDFVIAGYKNIKENENEQTENSIISAYSGLYTKDKFLKCWGQLVEEEIFHYTWNKMYRSEFIKGKIRFNEDIKISEDMIFNLDYLSIINSIMILDKSVYNHVLYNEESLTKKYHEGLFEMRRTTHLYIVKFLSQNQVYKGNNLRVANELYAKRIKSLFIYLMSLKTQMKNSEKLRIIEKIVTDGSVQKIAESFDSGVLSRTTSHLIKRKGKRRLLCTYKIFNLALSFKSMLKKND